MFFSKRYVSYVLLVRYTVLVAYSNRRSILVIPVFVVRRYIFDGNLVFKSQHNPVYTDYCLLDCVLIGGLRVCFLHAGTTLYLVLHPLL